MIKVYKWSKLLNYLTSMDPHPSWKKTDLLDELIKRFEVSTQNDFYKYLKIIVVRSGSPVYNKVAPNSNKLSPYFNIQCNSILEFPDGKMFDDIISTINSHSKLIVSNEYWLWTKLKTALKDFDIEFVSLKDMYESDIEYYIGKDNLIEYEEFEECATLIDTEKNSEYKSKSTFYYSVAELEKLTSL